MATKYSPNMTIEELETLIGISSVKRGNPYDHYTEAQWLEHFQELEQYPEAAKAMKLYNSKLYKALK